jgi:phage FluMu protein Com
MEVHGIAIPLGIYDADTAAQEEGYAPGSVDFAPVPFAPPAAVPTALPVARSAADGVRCSTCGAKIAESAGPGTVIACRKCKTMNRIDEDDEGMVRLEYDDQGRIVAYG